MARTRHSLGVSAHRVVHPLAAASVLYRHRDLDTRVGTIDVAVPKLRRGTYFSEWLLEHRKRAETALITVVADCYLAGVSTRRIDKLVKTLGIHSLSKSQVSRMAADLDEQVDQFRHRPLDDAGPFTFVAADALTMKVREGGRVINAVVLVASGVNADGRPQIAETILSAMPLGRWATPAEIAAPVAFLLSGMPQ